MTKLSRRDFFLRVPQLFERANRLAWEKYEETLYAMQRPITHGNYHRVRQFVGGNPPIQALRDGRAFPELDRILSRAKYPRTGHLTRIADLAEENVEFATALLHFNNPAYPVFDALTARGVQQLGQAFPYAHLLDESSTETYQHFVDYVQGLKDDVPFYCVPERNYYLTRIVQLSLWELGRQSPGFNGDKDAHRETAPAQV